MIANSYKIMSKIREALNDIFKEKKHLGLTQKAIAERIGCSQSYVSEMLSGDKHMNDETIEAFCDALGVTFADLDLSRGEHIELKEKDKERVVLLEKLHIVLTKSERAENILKAAINAAFEEVKEKSHNI